MCKQLCCWQTPYTRNEIFNECGPVTTRTTLECAKKTVDSMVMVGLTKKLPEATQLLTYLTGIVDLRSTDDGHLNVRKRPAYTPTAEEVDEMRASLRFDIELHAYAEARFEKDYADALAHNPLWAGMRNTH